MKACHLFVLCLYLRYLIDTAYRFLAARAGEAQLTCQALMIIGDTFSLVHVQCQGDKTAIRNLKAKYSLQE